MPEKLIKIEFQERKSPYNTKIILDLSMLKQLMPLIQPEILKGLVDTSGEDLVIIHINLPNEKVLKVKDLKKTTRERKIA